MRGLIHVGLERIPPSAHELGHGVGVVLGVAEVLDRSRALPTAALVALHEVSRQRRLEDDLVHMALHHEPGHVAEVERFVTEMKAEGIKACGFLLTYLLDRTTQQEPMSRIGALTELLNEGDHA